MRIKKKQNITLIVIVVICITIGIFFLTSLIRLSNTNENKLKRLGYSDLDISLIEELSEENKKYFFDEYNENYLNIIKSPYFFEDNLDLYIENYGKAEDDALIKVINNGDVRKYGFEDVYGIFSDPFYMEKNNDKYFLLLDKFDTYRELVEYVNVQRYDEYYTNIKPSDLNKDYLVLVNKYNYLESDYEPDIVPVDEYYGLGYMRPDAYEDFKEMVDDARSVGANIRSVSPYRMWQSQYKLYNAYLEDDPQEVVDTYSARPGHSEHQTGLAVDVSIPGVSLDDFYTTEASTWVNENSYKYGFIVRYQEGKEDITGYMFEPWHIRYVGKDVAKQIYDLGITFDEYYEYYLR